MGEITLQHAFVEFKTVYMPARNLASRTRIEYANDLEDFIRFLEESFINRVEGLQVTHIDQYLAKLDAQGMSGATRKRKAITIRSFLQFLFRNKLLTNDLASKVILPFQVQNTPRILSQAEYKRLLQSCSSDIRDTAIITLLLQTGIRLSELIRLTVFDLDTSLSGSDEVRIGKSGSRKGRVIPLNSKACQAINAYLNIRQPTKFTNLFINHLGQPMGPRGIQKQIMKYYRQAGITGASVHSLRHTFAVQHIVKGTSLETLQEVIGHQDIRTTERYVPLANELIRKELEENAL